MPAYTARNGKDQELGAILDDPIPDIPDADRLAVALRFAQTAREQSASAHETAEAFMMLGLHSNSTVAEALDRNGHVEPPAKNSRSRAKAA